MVTPSISLWSVTYSDQQLGWKKYYCVTIFWSAETSLTRCALPSTSGSTGVIPVQDRGCYSFSHLIHPFLTISRNKWLWPFIDTPLFLGMAQSLWYPHKSGLCFSSWLICHDLMLIQRAGHWRTLSFAHSGLFWLPLCSASGDSLTVRLPQGPSGLLLVLSGLILVHFFDSMSAGHSLAQAFLLWSSS